MAQNLNLSTVRHLRQKDTRTTPSKSVIERGASRIPDALPALRGTQRFNSVPSRTNTATISRVQPRLIPAVYWRTPAWRWGSAGRTGSLGENFRFVGRCRELQKGVPHRLAIWARNSSTLWYTDAMGVAVAHALAPSPPLARHTSLPRDRPYRPRCPGCA